MYIEDLDELFLVLSIKRFKTISEVQKNILRRQNRYKKILSLHTKLYEEWFKLVKSTDQDNVVDENENFDSCFIDYHTLLLRLIENHLAEQDQLQPRLQNEKDAELLHKQQITEERKKIDEIQRELTFIYRQEDKIAKTVHASNLPTGVYQGFMENVLSGIKEEIEINFEEYSAYCQVKWTLESVEREYLSQLHFSFDLKMEENEITDSILDAVDQTYAMEVFESADISQGEHCIQNLYNVYGFDDFVAYKENADDECYASLDMVVHNDEEEQAIDQSDIFSHEEKMEITPEEETPPKLLPDSAQTEETLIQERNLFSSYLCESVASEENIEDSPPLELDLDAAPVEKTDKKREEEESVFSTDVQTDKMLRSSQVMTHHNVTKCRLPRVAERVSSNESTSSFGSVSSESSIGRKGKSPKRKLNVRRHKLPCTADKELFFLPADDFDEQFENTQNTSKENESKSDERKEPSPIPVISAPEIRISVPFTEEKPRLTREDSSSHKKLCRSKGDQSLTENDVQKITTDLLGAKQLMNIQTIIVDGRLLKIGDLTPYSIDRLSVKNRPRRLSIHKIRKN